MPFYAVRSGRNPGVYTSWDEASQNVKGFQGAVHKKFNTQSEANAFVQTSGGYSQPVSHSHTSQPQPVAQSYSSKPGHYQPFSRLPQTNLSSSGSEHHLQAVAAAAYSYDNGTHQNYLQSSDHKPKVRTKTTAPRASTTNAVNPSRSNSAYELIIYTDGACKGNSNVVANKCPAGFGTLILSRSLETIAEIFAPVELDSESPYYMGAEVRSNNTAELTAIGEAFIYVRDYAQNFVCHCSGACSCTRLSVSVRYDSEYAALSVKGTFNGVKNKRLYETIRGIYRSVREGGTYSAGEFVGKRRQPVDIVFEKVKGHSGDTGNDRADHLANEGAAGHTCDAGRYQQAAVQQQQSVEPLGRRLESPVIIDLTGPSKRQRS